MQIVLSTRNPSKIEQIKAMFEDSQVHVITLDQAGIKGQAVEDSATLRGNAFKKSLFVHQFKPEIWAMADDTGIFIDALNGAPGVNTARWVGESKEARRATQWILKQLEGVTRRGAIFETIVAIVRPNGMADFFTGTCRGRILTASRCEPQPNMPYSSIFLPDKSKKVFAEMTAGQENLISHRGEAFQQARAFLESFL